MYDAVHVLDPLHPSLLGDGCLVQVLQALLGVEVEEICHRADLTVVSQGGKIIRRFKSRLPTTC